MILETYQEQQAVVQPDPPGQSFATVGTVYEDGIALIFNGAEAESLKHYKCNAAVRFAAGQRVRIIEDLSLIHIWSSNGSKRSWMKPTD